MTDTVYIMADYYTILELTPSADQAQIRAAYKRLAKKYHPDHNPDNKRAEEQFKEINEAYRTLSDPLKKSTYDSRPFSYYNATESTDAYWREIQKQKYQHSRSARTRGKAHPLRSYSYRFDKKYFKIQALAFVVFMVIAGFCFLTIHTVDFFIEQRQAKAYHMNSVFLERTDTLFMKGKYKEAIQLLDTLSRHDPMEFRFYFRRDSLTRALRLQANTEFTQRDYAAAIENYKILLSIEPARSFETLKRVASCEYNLGHFELSLQVLKDLYHQQPKDIELIYQMGLISHEKLHEPSEALSYFTLGKKLFKKNMIDIYGEAYELVMNPWDVPEIYFIIFERRATINIELKNYPDAITDCNWAIYLRPTKGKPYHLRALAKVKNNDFGGVCNDWKKAIQLGFGGGKKLQQKYCH